jgi:hypothetical protein
MVYESPPVTIVIKAHAIHHETLVRNQQDVVGLVTTDW